MRAIALSAFNYSANGIAVRTIAKDEEFDCRDDLIKGLVAKGRIELCGVLANGSKSADPGRQVELDEAAAKVKLAKEALDAAREIMAAAKINAETVPKNERKAAWVAFDETKIKVVDAGKALKAAETELKDLG